MTVCRNGQADRRKGSSERRSAGPLRHVFQLLICACLLTSCSIEVAPPVAITEVATLPPSTPTVPPPTRTPTAPPTAPLPTVTPTPPPTKAPDVTPTDIPTNTPNPQLADLGYCRRNFGLDDGARFSTRLLSISAARLALVDQ